MDGMLVKFAFGEESFVLIFAMTKIVLIAGTPAMILSMMK